MSIPVQQPADTNRNYAKGLVRRQEMIRQAILLFGKVGFRNATMLQIAAHCNISRAGLLHHFPSKELLLSAVLEERDEADSKRFVGSGPDDDGTGLLEITVKLAEHNSTVPGLVRLFAVLSAEATDADHPAHDFFIRRYQRFTNNFRIAFEKAQKSGLLAENADPGLIATELVAVMDGLQVQWLYHPESVDMARAIRQHIERLFITSNTI